MKNITVRRSAVIAIFFLFMLLHQTDKLLIGSVTPDIMKTFGIEKDQMGAVSTGALIVGALCYPLWGYLYDRYARSKLLALASFLWGATTWLNARAQTYTAFLITRSSTGIDDSSYPGLYSLAADYFGPQLRGRVYGLLQLTGPLGYILGMALGLMLAGTIGWRNVFYLTGGMGIVLSVVIYFGVKDAPRGQSEPEMAGMEVNATYRFDWKTALSLFKIPSLRLLFIQGFFGVFPWNAITYWFITYLGEERGYDDNTIFVTMVAAVLVMAAGFPLGGALGDWLFKRTPRGRLLVSTVGVVMGAILLATVLLLPQGTHPAVFTTLLALAAIFIPFASPNVLSTVHDITLPEVRSTAVAIQYFIESAGAALSPWMVGIIARQFSLQFAFLAICTSTWLLCALFFLFTARLLPRDVAALRNVMRQRAAAEQPNAVQ